MKQRDKRWINKQWKRINTIEYIQKIGMMFPLVIIEVMSEYRKLLLYFLFPKNSGYSFNPLPKIIFGNLRLFFKCRSIL